MKLRKIFIGLIASIAVLSVVFGIFGNRYLAPRPGENVETAGDSGLPPGLTVPDVNSVVPENVAKPVVVMPAAPDSKIKLRIFNIEARDNKFFPDTVIVNQWDVVRLSLTATDKTYDFYWPDYGVKQTVKKGERKQVGFQATRSGKFAFYCERCGGPAKGPVGSLMIVASE